MRRMRGVTAALVSFLLLTGTGTGCDSAHGGNAIRVAVVPGENAGPLGETYRALLALLERSTGRPVEIIKVVDYQAAVEGLLADRVDVAELGPVTYLVGRHGGVDLRIAGVYRSGSREPSYRSVAVTRSGARIDVPAGLRGRHVCLVDPLSTSSGLIPRSAMLSAGLSADGAVEVTYTGGHDVALTDLRRGLCDVAFTSDEMYERVLPSRRFDLSGTEVVWRSDPIPNAPLVVRGSLDPAVRDVLVTALRTDFNVERLVSLGICTDSADCRLAADPSVTGLAPAEDATFDGIREACRRTGYRQCS
ncbi:phosphate/phosphite/phosphonate ABC transporter substrate-binding protein [Micromonospora sp. CPCC 205561]|uniref:phosphate/phosphite/phosphonate ABC transporter substrate-binding protein n=1 Tax=Micromonospora sp. CPCC 205561 TaxID=3122407 RepID=UPI002FF40B19